MMYIGVFGGNRLTNASHLRHDWRTCPSSRGEADRSLAATNQSLSTLLPAHTTPLRPLRSSRLSKRQPHSSWSRCCRLAQRSTMNVSSQRYSHHRVNKGIVIHIEEESVQATLKHIASIESHASATLTSAPRGWSPQCEAPRSSRPSPPRSPSSPPSPAPPRSTGCDDTPQTPPFSATSSTTPRRPFSPPRSLAPSPCLVCHTIHVAVLISVAHSTRERSKHTPMQRKSYYALRDERARTWVVLQQPMQLSLTRVSSSKKRI